MMVVATVMTLAPSLSHRAPEMADTCSAAVPWSALDKVIDWQKNRFVRQWKNKANLLLASICFFFF
jgi:hypothetical protein